MAFAGAHGASAYFMCVLLLMLLWLWLVFFVDVAVAVYYCVWCGATEPALFCPSAISMSGVLAGVLIGMLTGVLTASTVQIGTAYIGSLWAVYSGP